MAGRYGLGRILGEGTGGVVAEAEDLTTGLRRALKLYRQRGDADAGAFDELTWLSSLAHPSLVAVHDLGRLTEPVELAGQTFPRGTVYAAMELLQGASAASVIASTPENLRAARLRRMADELADALHLIHRQGLCHYDVKPDNVLVAANGRAVLADLGLVAPPSSVRAGRGTIPFMAPELLAGLGGDHRADLYSLGATLAALASGAPPFSGEGAELVAAVLTRKPLFVVPWLDEETASLLERLLRKDPSRRPSSALVVRAELARIAGDHRTATELSSLRQVVSPAFVGRGEAVQALAACLAEHARGEGDLGVVLLDGTPGVGKSRLVAEAVRRHRMAVVGGTALPVRVLRGSAEAILLEAGGSPFARGLRIAERAVLLDAHLVRESALQPVVIHLPELDQDPLGLALVQVRLRASTSPTDRGRVLLLVESCTSAADPVREARAGLLRLVVPPLSVDEIGELASSMLGAPLEPEAVRSLHRASAGLPGLAAERLRQAVGARWPVAGADESPGSLASLLARRRGLLEASARAVTDALAVWNGPASVRELASLADLPPEGTWSALSSLVADGTLTEEQGRVAWPSAAHASAWQSGVPASLRRRLHARAAELLTAHPSGADLEVDLRRARHLLGASRAGAASGALEVARRLVDGPLPARALPLLRQVLASADEALRPAARLLLGRLHVELGQYAQALEVLPQDARGEAALVRALALQRRGDYAEAEELLRAELATEEDPERRRQEVALLGQVLGRRGRWREVLELVRDTRTATSEDARRDEDAALLEAAGLAHFYLGKLDQAEGVLRRGSEVADAGAHRGQRARFSHLLGMVAFARGELRVAAERYRQALQLAEEDGALHLVASCSGNLGSVLVELGSYAEALDRLTVTVRELGRLGHGAELGQALCNLAGLFAALGDFGEAGRIAARVEELDAASSHTAGYLALLRAEVHRASQDWPAALGEADRAFAAFSAAGVERESGLAQTARVEALLGLGRLDEATQALDALPTAGETSDVAHVRTLAAARLARHRRIPTEALEALLETLADQCAALTARGAAPALWRTAARLGGLLFSSDKPAAARAVLERARRTLEELVSHAPEIYRERMLRDPDALALEADWRALVGGATDGARTMETRAAVGEAADSPQRLRRLLAINKRLNSELRLPNLLEMIVDTVIELTDAERGFLVLVEADGSFAVRVARNIDRRSLEGEELALSRSIAEQAVRRGDPVVTVDAAGDGRFQAALSVSDLRLRSVMAVPLPVKGRTVGALYVDHRLRRGVFGEAEVELVQDFADQAAIAIENARLVEENERRRAEIETLNQQLSSTVEHQSAELEQAREELRSNRQALALRHDYGDIVGRTPRMLDLFRLLDRVTDTDLPVVIFGESGTGKELVARAIHYNGRRSARPFVGENCGAIPETLLESVLFGHVRGAFTGADRDRRGLFEVASGGTLFLDEVSEMSPGMQTKLLRVLQDGEVRRVGGERSQRTDVRVIAAANRDLGQLVAQGRFREDLFYRLSVVRIEIPPLRERREDIPTLVEHFLAKHGGTGRRVSRVAMTKLQGYGWPGNVRELENEIMRAVALGGPDVEVADLSPHVGDALSRVVRDPRDLSMRPRVEQMERELIQEALVRTSGNHTQAARALGLSRFGLLKKLRRYNLEKGDGTAARGRDV
ncbi:MAG: sigma 54-interacting transcriptional regulator [Deltaproteobacteria bacterium]|nr:sigma 54-interacting transcriptional regulator [Deltaproteobacteria bacterium]